MIKNEKYINEFQAAIFQMIYRNKISDYSDEANKKKVLIISSIRGIAISKSIELRLKSGIHPFNVDVDIKDINKLDFLHNDYDCVIADYHPENMRNLKNTVYISKLFSQQEVLDVKKILLKLYEKVSYINNIFTEKLYYKDIEIREAINSSETDSNVDLPNFLREYSEYGFVVTLLLRKPIIWDNEFVRVVLPV